MDKSQDQRLPFEAPQLLGAALRAQGFKEVSAESTQIVCGLAERSHLAAGEVLFEEGERAEGFFFLLTGHLRIALESEGASEVLGVIGCGECLGWSGIEPGGTRGASARAIGPCELLFFSKAVWEVILAREPHCAEALFANLQRRRGSPSRLSYRPSPSDLIDLLARLMPWSTLSPQTIEAMEPWLEWMAVPRGELLIRQGEPAEHMYILLEGRLGVSVTLRGEERWVDEVKPGEPVGEMGVLTDSLRTATVRCLRDSQLLCLSKAGCQALFEKHPQIIQPVMMVLIKRFAEQVSRSPHQRSTRRVTTLALLALTRGVSLDDFGHRLAQALPPGLRALCVSSGELPDSVQAELAGPNTSQRHLSEWLVKAEAGFDLVILLADDTFAAWAPWCMRQADTVVQLAHSRDRLDAARIPRQRAEPYQDHELVLLHPTHQKPHHTARWLSQLDVSDHHHLREGSTRDMARLARCLMGRAVGLALSGGGLRGAAHIGVLRALNEAGIEVDVVAGTSVGAGIGAFVAMDMTPDAILEEMLAWEKNKPTGDITLPFVSMLAGRRAERFLKARFSNWHIEDLWKSFFCVAANLTRARVEVLREGPLWKAAQASSALPGIVPPVLRGGDILVDGCVLNNLPGDLILERHRCRLISVNVSPVNDLRVGDARLGYPKGVRMLPELFKRLWNPGHTHAHLPLIHELLVRASNVSTLQKSEDMKSISDLYIAPDVGRHPLFSWRHIREMEEEGYLAACEALKHNPLWLA